jgi:hypothetical protein
VEGACCFPPGGKSAETGLVGGKKITGTWAQGLWLQKLSLVTLQECDRCGLTRASVSELHSGSPLSKGRYGVASDFHCMTWSIKTTHHNTRSTQEAVCERQDSSMRSRAVSEPVLHPHASFYQFNVGLTLSSSQPVTGGTSS